MSDTDISKFDKMEKNSFVRICLLNELVKGPASGYDLMHNIAEQMGGKKPSSGTIYPLLKDLTDTKQISFKQVGRKKIYKITAKGKKTVQELEKAHQSIMEQQNKMMKMFSGMSNKKSTAQKAFQLAKQPFNTNKWMRYNMDVVGEYKQEVINLISSPFDENKAEHWRKHMQKQIQYLKKLQQS